VRSSRTRAHTVRSRGSINEGENESEHGSSQNVLARGIEAVTLAKLMGHEDIRETLNTYSHLWDRARTDDVVREAMAR